MTTTTAYNATVTIQPTMSADKAPFMEYNTDTVVLISMIVWNLFVFIGYSIWQIAKYIRRQSERKKIRKDVMITWMAQSERVNDTEQAVIAEQQENPPTPDLDIPDTPDVDSEKLSASVPSHSSSLGTNNQTFQL
eukprot:100491_1